jgi:aryl-phospho-beta-D-glucosidase BglC (GH1 family)
MNSLRALVGLALLLTCFSSEAFATFLTRKGNKLVDANGKEVRLTGVNWFGFETGNLSPHGLWARDWYGVLKQVKELGFNSVRIPYTDAMLEPGAEPQSITTYGNDPYRPEIQTLINQELEGKSPLEMLDVIIGGCRSLPSSRPGPGASRERPRRALPTAGSGA